MDKKQILENLKKKYDEIKEEYEQARKDIVYFENEPKFEEYKSYKEDIVKKQMFPKEYEAYQKLEQLDPIIDAFDKEVINAATNLAKELNDNITNLEKKLEVNDKYLEEPKIKIERIENEIKDIESSEKYKKADEETLIIYNTLKKDLESEKSKVEDRINRKKEITKELDKLKAEKDDLISEYGEEIDVSNEKIEEETQMETNNDVTNKDSIEEKNNKEEEKNNKEEEKNNKEEEKTQKQRGGVVIPQDNNGVSDKLTEEEKAKKEQEDKDNKLKQDYADLSAKAKKGKLTEKELDSFIEILKDKENYDKLGLSMGLIFNKTRGIFKTLNKTYKGDESKLASINEAYSIYEEKFYEKHGEEKLKKLSKFFAIDEVEHREATLALPEKIEEKSEKTTLEDELASKNVSDEEYVDVHKDSKTKEEPSKEEI